MICALRLIIGRIKEDGEAVGARFEVLLLRAGRGIPHFISSTISSFEEHCSEIFGDSSQPCSLHNHIHNYSEHRASTSILCF